MTHREYRTWVAHLDQEWNEPDRTDHYLMKIAAEVARKFAKHPEQITPDTMRLRFGAAPKPITPEEAVEQSKRVWGGVAAVHKARNKQNGR